MPIIHLLRHGETEFNRLGIIQGSGVDSSLNTEGQRQALAFYQHYRHIPFELVVTSRLQRTRQTVQHFIDTGIPWMQHVEVNEINWGIQEGQPSSPENIAEYDRVTKAWQSGQYDVRVEGGESAWELGQRLERFIEWLRERQEDHLLICSHGRTIRALVTLMKGLPLSTMEEVAHHNTGCYIFRAHQGAFEVEVANSTEHLHI